jgi:general secretion pathway protein G
MTPRRRVRSMVRAASAGFTLIELVITVAIVGILASAAVPLVEVSVQRQKEIELSRALRDIRRGLDDYKKAWDEGRIAKKADESGYPATLDVLVEGAPDAKDPQKRRIYFMRRIPRDPFFEDGSVRAVETWGRRSYASPPNAPAPGADVFDVHSLSDRVGLNGVPLSAW